MLALKFIMRIRENNTIVRIFWQFTDRQEIAGKFGNMSMDFMFLETIIGSFPAIDVKLPSTILIFFHYEDKENL